MSMMINDYQPIQKPEYAPENEYSIPAGMYENEFTAAEKESIMRGLQQLDAGQGMPFEQAFTQMQAQFRTEYRL